MLNRFSELEVQTTDFQVQQEAKTRNKPRFFDCKGASINVRSASDESRLCLILRECVKAGLMFVGVQEARIMDKGSFALTVENVTNCRTCLS